VPREPRGIPRLRRHRPWGTLPNVNRISTIVITKNEETNIERCLRSVAPFSREIIVVDSGSTDGTVASAERFGARVLQRPWPGFGAQKQFALEQAQQDWVFSIDADEEVSPSLCQEICALDFAADGYEMPRRVRYLGRWIRHGSWYPGYVLRLFRRGAGRFTADRVHERVVVQGRKERLRHDLLHYSYRDIGHHLGKIDGLTSLAAMQMHEAGARSVLPGLVLRPPLEFLRVYLLRRGFRDGIPGLVVAALHGTYVFLRYAKLYELRRRDPGEAPPP